MLDVTLDLITQTASSSLLAFCFCNLIIVIILVGSKPGSEFEKEESHGTPLSTVSATNKNGEEVLGNPKDEDCKEKNELVVVKEVSNAQNAVCDDDDNDDNNEKDEDEGGDDDDDDDDDDDELRKRVEEFIEKVNRGWKAELSKTPHLV